MSVCLSVPRTPPLPAQARANGRSGRLRTPLQAMKLLRQVAPLLVLGGGRLATHALLGYQVRRPTWWKRRLAAAHGRRARGI